MRFYYLDTSVQLDFLENRNEPGIPKGEWAKKLIKIIIEEEDKIIVSDNNLLELANLGYTEFDIDGLLMKFKLNIVFVESTGKEIGKAKDLAYKREIPKRDALHALIARDNEAILITLDRHFQKLSDIIKPHSPKEFISS